jgi:hypothetical protein
LRKWPDIHRFGHANRFVSSRTHPFRTGGHAHTAVGLIYGILHVLSKMGRDVNNIGHFRRSVPDPMCWPINKRQKKKTPRPGPCRYQPINFKEECSCSFCALVFWHRAKMFSSNNSGSSVYLPLNSENCSLERTVTGATIRVAAAVKLSRLFCRFIHSG